MNADKIQQAVKLVVNIAEHEYKGQRDDCGSRNGNGKERWWNEIWEQKYSGEFFQDSLHNEGVFEWYSNSKLKCIYEGRFFVNNLEGYGVMSYPDGKMYEGLFKDNRRYGPGVLTYPDGTQDVGFWEGNVLVRLNQIIPHVNVPRLADSSNGKAFILNYKTVIPLQEKYNLMNDILSTYDCSDSDNFYFLFIRNSKSLFFNEDLYKKSYYQDNQDWYLETVKSEEYDGTPIVKRTLITHLIAWNNEKTNIDLMLHAFRHRNFENSLSYNISYVLMNHREKFRKSGIHEVACMNFLNSCCIGKVTTVIRQLCGNHLYPDVSDCLGNNGIIYAAVNDQVMIIKVLTDFGANVDHLNDECLTALNLCLLRYIALKNDIVNWDAAFVVPMVSVLKSDEVQFWRYEPEIKNRKTITPVFNQSYLFDLECIHPKAAMKSGEKKEKPLKKEKPTKEKTKKGTQVEEPEVEIEDPKTKVLEKVIDTFVCLLESGADPNFGKVPFPPLICSLFTKSENFINTLFKHGANPNIKIADRFGGLTPLHIVVSLHPAPELITMAELLLLNGAIIDETANSFHWPEEKDIILSGTEIEDTGKTPLHLLCMRYDYVEDHVNYFENMFTLLVNHGANVNLTYLGHTPYTLAILRGNIKIMHCLLISDLVTANQELDNNMGVPLTLLVLKRYESILPISVCEKVFSCLMEFNANPLNIISNCNLNAIEFCNRENMPPEGSKKKAKLKKSQQKIIQILTTCAETTLLKHIKTKVVKAIYVYKFECCFDNPIFEHIVKFINSMEEASKILEILIVNKLVFTSMIFCEYLLTLVKNLVKPAPVKGKKKNIEAPVTVNDILYEMRMNILGTITKYPPDIPEIDTDEDKYKVCFECLQKKDKELILCPSCQLIYFCSKACNTKNNKKKTSKHPCRKEFYDAQKKIMLEEELSNKVTIYDHFDNLRNEIISSMDNYYEYLHKKEKQKTFYRQMLRKSSMIKTKERSKQSFSKDKVTSDPYVSKNESKKNIKGNKHSEDDKKLRKSYINI